MSDNIVIEKHLRVGELAKAWGFGRETLRKIFKDEPGVLVLRAGQKQANCSYSIPLSVAERVHTRLTNSARPGVRV